MILFVILSSGVELTFFNQKNFRKNGCISDATDGTSYHEAVIKMEENFPNRKAITFPLCTDGVQIHESDKKSAWQIFLVCKQIDHKAR